MDTSTLFTLLIVGIVILFFIKRLSPVKGVKNVNEPDFRQMLDKSSNKMLIDVREPHEYKAGFIAGAVNIPLSQLSQRYTEIPKDKNIFLYCRSGMRSAQAGRVLSKQGFANMVNLQGGISAWRGKISKK